MKICPICSREYSDNYTFCDQHGSRLIDHSPAPPPLPLARLQITTPDGTQREFELPASAITIGKSEENELRVTDGAISRRHAIIEPSGPSGPSGPNEPNGPNDEGWLIKDLGSLNGVFVNERRIGEQGHVLQDGDQIVIGRTNMVFRSKPSEPIQSAPVSEPGAAPQKPIVTPLAAPPPSSSIQPPLAPPPPIVSRPSGSKAPHALSRCADRRVASARRIA